MRNLITGLDALPAIGVATVAALSALGTSARPALADEGRMSLNRLCAGRSRSMGNGIAWTRFLRARGRVRHRRDALVLSRGRRASEGHRPASADHGIAHLGNGSPLLAGFIADGDSSRRGADTYREQGADSIS